MISTVLYHLEGTVHLLQQFFYIVLVIRMVASFLPPRRVGLWDWITRISYRLTEPIVAPIRNRVPLAGMLDFSPLIALFLVDIVGYLLIQLLNLLAGL